MPLNTDSIEEPQLNLTSMIDIVFLLIIFFMVGTQFTQAEREFDIQLPTTSDAQPLSNLPDDVIINVRENGEVVVERKVLTLQELKEKLELLTEKYADQAIIIRGEGQGPYQNVISVMAACRKAKVKNLSLASQMKKKED